MYKGLLIVLAVVLGGCGMTPEQSQEFARFGNAMQNMGTNVNNAAPKPVTTTCMNNGVQVQCSTYRY